MPRAGRSKIEDRGRRKEANDQALREGVVARGSHDSANHHSSSRDRDRKAVFVGKSEGATTLGVWVHWPSQQQVLLASAPINHRQAGALAPWHCSNTLTKSLNCCSPDERLGESSRFGGGLPASSFSLLGVLARSQVGRGGSRGGPSSRQHAFMSQQGGDSGPRMAGWPEGAGSRFPLDSMMAGPQQQARSAPRLRHSSPTHTRPQGPPPSRRRARGPWDAAAAAAAICERPSGARGQPSLGGRNAAAAAAVVAAGCRPIKSAASSRRAVGPSPRSSVPAPAAARGAAIDQSINRSIDRSVKPTDTHRQTAR